MSQRMVRQQTLAKEHTEEYKAALQRAVTLAVPHAYTPFKYGTFDEGRTSSESSGASSSPSRSSKRTKIKESWYELIERLFDKDEYGHITFKKPHTDD